MSVVNQLKVLKFELLDIAYVFVQLEVGEGVRHTLQLLLQRLYVIRVDVGVTQNVDKFTALKTADLS